MREGKGKLGKGNGDHVDLTYDLTFNLCQSSADRMGSMGCMTNETKLIKCIYQ